MTNPAAERATHQLEASRAHADGERAETKKLLADAKKKHAEAADKIERRRT
jgi:hypothetical protein